MPEFPGCLYGLQRWAAAQGGYPASVTLLKSDGTKVWEHTTYTWGGTIYNIGTVTGSPAVSNLDNDGRIGSWLAFSLPGRIAARVLCMLRHE